MEVTTNLTTKIRFRTVVIIIALSLCIMPIISYLNSGNSNLAHAIPNSVAIDSNDVSISITPNATTIGQHTSLLFQVELTNTLSESVFEIQIDTSQSSPLISLSSSIDLTSNISDIAPQASVSFDIFAELKENITTLSVDLLVIIDASGSMGNEIDSIKAKINTLTSSLSQEIPNLRMGVIVYGWDLYNEHPFDSRNQLQFTSDFNAVHTFINSLYASGGLEPWGDALNVANTYDWRTGAQKLIIMIGDEDCDPGNIVGHGETGGYYNGSELLNEVQSLKDKGVIINTVATDNPDANVANQFGWISRFTNGESVYLPDFEAQGIELPDLIEKWTLELNREFFQEFKLSISWENLEQDQFSNSEISTFWLDLASPSIIVSEYVKTVGLNLYDVGILATVSDFSNISSVIIFHNGSGSLSFTPMISLPNSSYFLAEVKNMPEGTNLTYFIDASDIFNNNGKTGDMWFIVETPKRSVDEKTTIWAESNDQFCSEIEFDQNIIHYLIMSGSVDINSMIVNLLYPGSSNQQTPSIIYTQNVSSTIWRIIIPTVYSSGIHFLNMTIPQDKGNFIVSFVWVTLTDMNGSSSNVFTDVMTEEIRVKGLEWSAVNRTYFSITFDYATPLVAIGEVYTTDWVYLGQFSALSSFSISENATYYVLIWATLRTGEYSVHLGERLENTDPYRTKLAMAPGFEVYIGILAIFCLYQLFKRTGKRKNR